MKGKDLGWSEMKDFKVKIMDAIQAVRRNWGQSFIVRVKEWGNLREPMGRCQERKKH